MNWLEELYEEKNESIAIGKMRDKLDFLVFTDDRGMINDILTKIDVDKLFMNALFSVLKMVKSMKHRLESYHAFFKLVETRAIAEGLEEEIAQFKEE